MPSSGPRKLNGYQNRTTKGACRALDAGSDVLIQAPTGSGKTGILSRIALETSEKTGKVLILTHRQKLFDQISQEVASWTGITPGSVSSDSMVGVDQSPSIVIGMVETVAGRLDDLDQYAAILIDETHHVSQQSAERNDVGSYARIIDACPGARLVGLTATIFRGDGDELHPRLEAAHREVVSVEEARREGRIVPAKTVEGRAPLTSGRTPADLARQELEGKLGADGGKTASAITRKQRGDAYYDTITEDWSQRFNSKQAILFMDSIDEVEDMKSRFAKFYGDGVAVAVHGRTLSSDKDGGGRKKVNDSAIDDYSKGRAKVLIACQMIGEGFDVPQTDLVMSANASLSRLEMNQIAGRGIRASDGKTFGIFADYGTASVLHGKVESQHELMDVDAWSAAGSITSAARAIGRCATAKSGDWSCMAGESASLLLRRDGTSYQIFRIDEKATRSSKSSSHGKTWDVMKSESGKQRFTLQETARIVSDQARTDAGYYARMGGFDSMGHTIASQRRLSDSEGMFKYYEGGARGVQTQDSAALRRAQIVSDALDGRSKGGINSALVARALCKSRSGSEMLRETIGLCQIALEKASVQEGMPIGRRSESATISKELSERSVRKMTGGQLQKEAKALAQVVPHIALECDNKDVKRVLGDLSEPLLKGQKMLIRDARLARA